MEMKIVAIKKSKLNHPAGHRLKALRAVNGDAAPAGFAIVDNEDDTLTIHGTDGTFGPDGVTPNLVDISQIATLSAAASSDPTMLTVDPPVGMDIVEHAIAPGSPTVSVTATFNDGLIGPFTISEVETISAPAKPDSGVIGLIITHGAPSIRPVNAPPAPPVVPSVPPSTSASVVR